MKDIILKTYLAAELQDNLKMHPAPHPSYPLSTSGEGKAQSDRGEASKAKVEAAFSNLQMILIGFIGAFDIFRMPVQIVPYRFYR